MALIPYSPLHAGLLAGALAGSSDLRVERHHDRLFAYESPCRDLGTLPAAVAVAWLPHNPLVASTIVGVMTIDEPHLDLVGLSVRLDDAAMTRLDDWPGPGRAPQSYA